MDKLLAVDTSYTTVAIPQRRIYPCSMNFQMLNKCNRNKKIGSNTNAHSVDEYQLPLLSDAKAYSHRDYGLIPSP